MATEITITLRTNKEGRDEVSKAMKPIWDAIRESEMNLGDVGARKIKGVGEVVEIKR